MARYVRFEVYVPVHFSIMEESADKVGKVLVKYSLDSQLVVEFAHEAVLQFGGATQAHPADGPPFRGWWWSDTHRQLLPDDVTYLFVLVEMSRLNEPEEFFSLWQQRFAKEMNQEVIFVLRWPLCLAAWSDPFGGRTAPLPHWLLFLECSSEHWSSRYWCPEIEHDDSLRGRLEVISAEIHVKDS